MNNTSGFLQGLCGLEFFKVWNLWLRSGCLWARNYVCGGEQHTHKCTNSPPLYQLRGYVWVFRMLVFFCFYENSIINESGWVFLGEGLTSWPGYSRLTSVNLVSDINTTWFLVYTKKSTLFIHFVPVNVLLIILFIIVIVFIHFIISAKIIPIVR